VIIVTPMSNLDGRDYWVVSNDQLDAFAIRLSARLREPAQFSGLVVQSELPEPVADEEVPDETAADAAEEVPADA
jgi:hypothetical protein